MAPRVRYGLSGAAAPIIPGRVGVLEGHRSVAERFQADAEIIRQIYDSLLEAGQWPALLNSLARSFASTYALVMTQDLRTGVAEVTAINVPVRERQQVYETYYGPRSPTLSYGYALRPGQVFTDEMYENPDDYWRSEIYNDFFRPLAADHFMYLQVGRRGSDERSLVLRRGRRAGPYDRRQVQRLAQLGRHFCSVERLGASLRVADHHNRNLQQLLDHLGRAAIVADAAGRILYASEPAAELLRQGGPLRAVDGRLEAGRGLEPRLRQAIRDCMDGRDDGTAALHRVLPLEGGRAARLIFVSALTWRQEQGGERPAALIVVGEPADRAMPAADLLAESFGLTPTEGRVAAALCRGCGPADYAAANGVSVLTARTLLKRIQEKTGTHSQAALVGLLLGSTADRPRP